MEFYLHYEVKKREKKPNFCDIYTGDMNYDISMV